jgi:hypothetical protein
MLRQLDRVYEAAKRMIELKFTADDEMAAKLRAMTVENGCTAEEAAVAAAKLADRVKRKVA